MHCLRMHCSCLSGTLTLLMRVPFAGPQVNALQAILAHLSVHPRTHRMQGQYLQTLLALSMGTWLLIVYAALVVLQLRPLWDAQSVIPVLGMLLGNATSGVSVGLNTALQDLASSKEHIELLLALGANRAEATKSVVQKALTNAMMPTVNMMAVMGLVSIPGMMTGQILAGADPSDASRYQMMIVFLVSGSTGIAAMAAVHMAVWHIIDEGAHYRPERILPRRNFGESWRLGVRRVRMALGRTKDLCLTCLCCVTPSVMSSTWQKRPSPLSRYEMMHELVDGSEDEEEGLQGEPSRHGRQALMRYQSPPRADPSHLYPQGGVAGSPSDEGLSNASSRGTEGLPMMITSKSQQGLSGQSGGGWGGESRGYPGMHQDGSSHPGCTALSPSSYANGPGQHLSQHQMEPPPLVTLDAPVAPPQTSRRFFGAASALGMRLANAAYTRLGASNSVRGAAGTGSSAQYVPLTHTQEDPGGGAPSDHNDLGSNQGSVQVGASQGQQGGRSRGHEEVDTEAGMVSAAGSDRGGSGASTPHDEHAFGSPEAFFDAQSIGGSSSFSSASGQPFVSRRPSYSSHQGRSDLPGRSTPPRT
ncbi:hypothetical protein DUNSADRAFT_15088 [Dunaliella salina]|uniref:Uncharacterized protein n=1 Tax=Dunaliella salina TaxID=3046 RepID=A0ABQ7G621_DUNSA|nr:hypothetical protein DUNSADRAFT_15088 [Dunaliella salina]|eukprot:KAF5830047.1 hypothetical protein DUNSADRAFT_15088 [Dunaliella salina]